MSGVDFEIAAPPIGFMSADVGSDLRELDADAVIFGAPHGTPYDGIDNRVHEGAPDALRQSLEEDARWADHWNFDFDGTVFGNRGFKLADLGNLKTAPLDGAGNREKIEAVVRAIRKRGAVPIMIGGDDSVPIPFIAGFSGSGPVTIVQVDAHIDWREERRGEPLGFSSTMRRASEMDHVDRIIQIGMRGIGSAREGEVIYAQDWGAEIVTAREIHTHGIGAALKHLPEGADCIFTIDCDALDPAEMPAVMAPTPGGLTYTQVIELIGGVIDKANLIGFDLIEFVPGRDPSGVAAYTGAHVICNAIGGLARRK